MKLFDMDREQLLEKYLQLHDNLKSAVKDRNALVKKVRAQKDLIHELQQNLVEFEEVKEDRGGLIAKVASHKETITQLRMKVHHLTVRVMSLKK